MRLRVRQASFNHLTIGHPNDDIMMLDYEATSWGKTLRSMIVGIQSMSEKKQVTYAFSF